MSKPIVIKVIVHADVIEQALGLEIAKKIAEARKQGDNVIAVHVRPADEKIYGLPLV